MEFGRHARNEMRLYGLAEADVAAVIAHPEHVGEDHRDNHRLPGARAR